MGTYLIFICLRLKEPINLWWIPTILFRWNCTGYEFRILASTDSLISFSLPYGSWISVINDSQHWLACKIFEFVPSYGGFQQYYFGEKLHLHYKEVNICLCCLGILFVVMPTILIHVDYFFC